MSLDRAAWERKYRQDAESKAAETRAAAALARLRQAAVPLERLTGSDHWDTFLRLVERMQEADREALADLQGRLASPAWLSAADLARLRHLAAILQAQITARAQVTDLPRSIIQDLQQVSEAKAVQ